jgi:hypothetical protein
MSPMIDPFMSKPKAAPNTTIAAQYEFFCETAKIAMDHGAPANMVKGPITKPISSPL